MTAPAGADRDATMPLISIVVPVFNEAPIIRANLLSILRAAEDNWYRLELIAVDDGAADDSATEIAAAASEDSRIRLVSFTRNFGKEAAILAGMQFARGDAVVVLDGDLQHPPELIVQMAQYWKIGIYVVEAVKFSRGKERWYDGLLADGFYRLFKGFSGMDLRGQSDFKLLDRVVVDAYLAFPERQRFFRGIIGWAQYASVQLPFSVAGRSDDGAGKWTRLKLLRYAIRNITSFSSLPLKLVSLLGFLTLGFGAIVGAISMMQKLNGQAIDGFTTVNLLVIIIGGAILLSLGIIGHYLARLYDEVKGRPHFVVKPTRKRVE